MLECVRTKIREALEAIDALAADPVTVAGDIDLLEARRELMKNEKSFRVGVDLDETDKPSFSVCLKRTLNGEDYFFGPSLRVAMDKYAAALECERANNATDESSLETATAAVASLAAAFCGPLPA